MTTARHRGRKFLTAAVVLMVIGFLLRAYGLSDQPPSSDDIGVVLSAENYVETGHLGPTMWNHPGLRNILVFLSRGILGTGVAGLKAVSVAFGSLSVLLLYLVTRRIFRNDAVALLAALFLALDPLHIDFSRQGVHEVYMPFFFLAGMYFALKYRDDTGLFWLLLSGACFGLGVSSKWYVAVPLALTYALLIYSALAYRGIGGYGSVQSVIFISSALILLPLAVYLLTFIPWFARGYTVPEWISLQKFMYIETTTHSGYNPYGLEIDHRAYVWFLKPVAFADFIFSDGRPTILLGISNPLVWLLTIPAMIYVTVEGMKRGIIEYIFLFLLFLGSYVPLVMTHRPIWVHTAFSVIPYAFMAVAFSLWVLLGGGKRGKAVLTVYLSMVVIVSIPLYLLAIGKGLDSEVLKSIVLLYEPSYEWRK